MTPARLLRRWAWPCLLAIGCSSTPGSVDRVVDGRTWTGRYVNPTAYAWYARGVQLEAEGRLQLAEKAFLEAARHDPKSGSVWARIGALRCLQGAEDSDEAFERGWATGQDRTTLLVERGRCALRSGRSVEALADGREAVSRTPRSLDASLLVIDALLEAGRSEEALRWLDGLAAFAPGARNVQSRRIEEARSRGDVARERRAHEARSALQPGGSWNASAGDADLAARGLEALDAALIAGDVDRAFERATKLGVRAPELALRALVLGRPAIARDIATFVLDAGPHDVNARMALLLAGDLSTQPLQSPSPEAWPEGASASLHPLAVLLFGELLDRRIGREAGDSWRRSHPTEPSTDALVERLRARQPERTQRETTIVDDTRPSAAPPLGKK